MIRGVSHSASPLCLGAKAYNLCITMTSQELHANKPHVLVDDDTRICDLVCRYLLDQGFVVASSADAAQARELLKMADFDAAVIDVMMPDA